MGVTIIGPTAAEFPKRVWPVFLRVKRTWEDPWFWAIDLELVSAKIGAAGQGVSTCEFRRRYGSIKQPWQAGFASTVAYPNINDCWVQVWMGGEGGYQLIWVGKIAEETRDVHGTDSGPSGVQTWTAYGPERILQRIGVSSAFVETYIPINEQDEVLEIDWVPPINNSDDRQGVVGNRTELIAATGNSYAYEGDYSADGYVWSHYDYAEYLLDRFVDESAAGGPAWTLGGQADLLKDMTQAVDLDATQTVADILRKLIPVRLGLDYKIIPTADGFEVYVYALNAGEWSFGDQTLSRNPNTVRIYSSQTNDNLRTRIERSADEQYSRIRVLGQRVVSCCSLYAMNSLVDPDNDEATLVPKWSDDLDDEYTAGLPGGINAEQHEKFRQAERFRGLYSRFGAPTDWDFHAYKALPILNDDGTLDVAATMDEQTYPAHQTKIRRTLSWLPLREAVDYSTDPPTDKNPGVLGDFLPPIAWIGKARTASDRFNTSRLYPVDLLGISMSVSQVDYAVLFSCSPRHLLAEGYFTPVDAVPLQWPRFDSRRLVVTLAFETDQRLMLVAELAESEGGVTPSGGTKDYEVDAEFWYLAPNTAIDNGDEEFDTLKLSGDQPRVLRNDSDKLALVMAGAISRYYQERARAEIVIKGWLPWSNLIGQILTVVEEGGSTHTIQAPITSIEWHGGMSPTTIIRTGFVE